MIDAPTPAEVKAAAERLGFYLVCAAPPDYDPMMSDIEILLIAHARDQALLRKIELWMDDPALLEEIAAVLEK
jgi:hypothetical protein